MPNMRAARWACQPAGLAISALQATQKINLKKEKWIKITIVPSPNCSLRTQTQKKKRPKHCRSGTNLPSVVGRQEPRGAAFRRSSSQQQCPIHLADSQLRLPSSSLLIGVLCPIVRSKWENKSNFGDALMYGGASGCNGKEAAMLKIALLLPVITIYEN